MSKTQTHSGSLAELIEALRCLPGVGVRSAQRMAYHLLQHDRTGAERLSQALLNAVQRMTHCTRCHTFTEHEVCHLCSSNHRDASQLCVIENPADQAAMERTGMYKGLYFVLMGKLSPLEGIGPRAIGLDQLIERASDGIVREVILATNFTAEGQLTADAMTEALSQKGLKVTRLARGLPPGSELEYVDLSTIAHAFIDRR